jgi:hypothetical protein
VKAKVIHEADKRFFDLRLLYLKYYAKLQDELSKLPRQLPNNFFSFFVSTHVTDVYHQVPLFNLSPRANDNQDFIKEVNKFIKSVHPSSLDNKTQNLLGDIWDHLLYGMTVATICVESGNVGGPPGNLTQAKLDLIIKEPVLKKAKKKAEFSKSTGPFQINSSDNGWGVLGENLPSNYFWVHGAYFFHIALQKHKLVMEEFKRSSTSFTTDPSWIQDLYQRRDLFSYLLLWRRFYTGRGSYSNLDMGREDFDYEIFHRRNLAFAIISLAVMKARSNFIKHYPSYPRSSKDHENEALWKIAESI